MRCEPLVHVDRQAVVGAVQVPRAPRRALPSGVEPMLALLAKMPARQAAYAFEFKWDGVRALTYWDGKTLRLESRNLLDITAQYPELQALREALPYKSALLDGEVVAFDEEGKISFNALSHRMHVVGEKKIAGLRQVTPVTYMVFDVLHLDGHDLMGLSYVQRRVVLEQMGLAGPHWIVPGSYAGEGEALLECARASQLEGIVAKRLDAPYEPGQRSGAWLKIKLVYRQEFVIGGWTPYKETDDSRIGSILLGYYEQPTERQEPQPPKLRYVGSVGTGFSDQDRAEMAKLLSGRARSESPFDRRTKPAYYTEPDLVCELEFRGWVGDGRVRQPSFKGLRYDKDPREVRREDKGMR